MRTCAMVLTMVAIGLLAGPAAGQIWYQDPIEPSGGIGTSKGWPSYGNSGDNSLQAHPEWTANLPGDQAYRHSSGQSTFAPGGAGGVWTTNGTAALLVDPANSHNGLEQFSVDVRMDIANPVNFYVGQIKTSGLAGGTSDLLAYTGISIYEGGNGRTAKILSSAGWTETGLVLGGYSIPGAGANYYRLLWEFDVPNNSTTVSIIDQPTGLLYQDTFTNSGTISAVNGLVLLGANAGWLFDNPTFETVPEPATLSVLGLGGLVALIRRRR